MKRQRRAREVIGPTSHDNRRRIAVEAARLISELGIRDYHQAKLRAAERLGITDERSLPRNIAIEDALRDYQRLFLGEAHAARLDELRRCALQAMRFFAEFQPRLVGAVLEGTADQHSAVCLHLFSDDPDALARFLQDRDIPYDQLTRNLRWDRDQAGEFDAYRFSADEITMDLTLLPLDALRQAPLDKVDGKPMRRASVAALQALLPPFSELPRS